MMVCRDREAVPRTGKRPWLSFALLTLAIFLAAHNLSISIQESFGRGTAESIASRTAEGNPVRRVVFLLLGAWGLVSLFRVRRGALRVRGFLGWAILLYVVWCFGSYIWAQHESLALRRLVVFAMFLLAALAVAGRFSRRDILMFLFVASLSYLVVGFLAEVVHGTFQPLSQGYRFSGSVHPNAQGRNCGLILLAGFAAAHGAVKWRRLPLGIASIALVFLVLTGSRAAFSSAIAALLFYLMLVFTGPRKFSLVLAISLVLSILLLIAGEASLREGVLLGRGDSPESVATLTGRTAIWKDCRPYIAERPILGYGYASFWGPREIDEISHGQQWALQNAHCNYVDMLLQLGVVGLALFLLVWGCGIARALFRFQRSRDPVYAFFAAFLLFCMMACVFESIYLSVSHIVFGSFAVLAYLGFREDEELRRGAEELFDAHA